MLTTADLPSGWEIDPSASSDSGSSDSSSTGTGGAPACVGGDPTADPFKMLHEQSKIQFKKSGSSVTTFNLDLIGEQLARGSSEEASAAYAKIVAVLEPCLGRHAGQGGGSETISLRPLRVPADESSRYVLSLAFEATSAGAPSTGAPSTDGTTSMNLDVALDILIARKGGTLMLLAFAPDTKGDAALTALAEKALAKL